MATRIRLRYDSIDAWNNADPVATLLPGEFGVARHQDGTIEVRVGNGEGNNTVNWAAAPQISGAGTIIDGFDFTNLSIGDIIYWNGNGWDTASLSERITGGTNIQVIEDANTGKISINYFTATFSPTVNFNSENNSVNSNNIIIEVRNRYNNSAYNATNNKGGLGTNVDFTVSNGGNVNVANGTVLAVIGENYDSTGAFLTFTGAGNKSFPVTNMDTDGSFGANIAAYSITTASGTRSDTINVSLTSESTTTGGAPYTPTTQTKSLTFSYGIRYFFVWSQTLYEDASLLQAAYNLNSFNFTKQNDGLSKSVPLADQNITSPSGAGNWYLYFMHSSNGTGENDTFGWNPVFRALNNDQEIFTEISTGPSGIKYDTIFTDTNNPEKQYRVWRFSNPVGPSTTLSFKVGIS